MQNMLSVRDEIEYQNLPKEIKDLVEKRFDFYCFMCNNAYNQGYEEGRYEAKQELSKK